MAKGDTKRAIEAISLRLRDTETVRAEDSTNLKTLLSTVKDFAVMFKEHDEKEMAKYDTYDKHITDMNSTLTTLTAQMNVLSENKKDILNELSDVKDDMKALQQNFNALSRRQWISLGVVLGVSAVGGAIWVLFSYMDAKATVKDSTIAELTSKVHKLESNQNRNYDRAELKAKYGIIDSTKEQHATSITKTE